MRNALALVLVLAFAGCALDSKAAKALDSTMKVEAGIARVASDVHTILIENRPRIAAATTDIATVASDVRAVAANIRATVGTSSDIRQWLYGIVAAIAATLGHSVYAARRAKVMHQNLAKRLPPI